MEQGIPFYDAISEFITDLNNCNSVIGHNISFDIKKINDNIKKYIIPIVDNNNNLIFDIFYDKKIICTLKLYSNYIEKINLDRKKNNQKPLGKKLIDMYKYFFDTEFINAHNAINDVLATYDCYKKLIQ